MISVDLNGSPWVESHWALASPLPAPAECPIVAAQPAPPIVKMCAGWLAEPPSSPTSDIREVYLQTARALLLAPDLAEEIGRHARARLRERALDKSDLACLPLGLIITRRAMSDTLRAAGFASCEIRQARLLSDPRLPGRVVSPICDADGLIVSFWAWQPDDLAPRYLFLNRHWRRWAPLVGLETALRAAAHARHGLIVVEDPLESLLIRARGMQNVAAIAGRGRELTAWCWRRLAELGVARVTLVLNDYPGAMENLAAARESHRAVPGAPDLFFVLTERLAPWSTPGDLVHDRGIEALRALLDHAWRLTDSDAEPVEEPHEEIASPPPAEVQLAPQPARRARGDCEIHRCGETDCFCFD